MSKLTLDSPEVQIRAKYPDLTKAKINEIKTNFKKYDTDGNGVLDFDEIKRMLESVGQARTHLETKKMIAEVDTTGTGTINFDDFIGLIAKPADQPLPLLGKIYQTQLAGKAKFFEEKMRENQGLSQKQLEDRVKREAALRKEEREEKKKEKEKAASKARFNERMSAFKQG